jgi:hypothetical protein
LDSILKFFEKSLHPALDADPTGSTTRV